MTVRKATMVQEVRRRKLKIRGRNPALGSTYGRGATRSPWTLLGHLVPGKVPDCDGAH